MLVCVMASSPRKNPIRLSHSNVEGESERVLQARVAQQSELISLLKSRSDDTIFQLEECEKRNVALLSNQEELISKLHSEVECRQGLEVKLSQLSLKHSQTSMDMKSYESECDVLRVTVKELHAEKEARKEMVRMSQMNVDTMKEQIENHMRTTSTLKEALQEVQSRLSKTEQQNLQLQDKVVELKMENLSLDESLTRKKSEVDQWKTEHASLMQTCLGKETQLTEARHRVTDLEQKLDEKSEKILSLAGKFRLDADSLSKEQAISRMKWEVKQSREELQALKQEFEAYKMESKRQLAEERELNSKLRHLQ